MILLLAKAFYNRRLLEYGSTVKARREANGCTITDDVLTWRRGNSVRPSVATAPESSGGRLFAFSAFSTTHTTPKSIFLATLPWPMSEGRQHLLNPTNNEQATIASERLFNPSGETVGNQPGSELQERHRRVRWTLVEAYAKALPKRGGLAPTHVLREYCQFLVRFSTDCHFAKN
jgi:hypothetical protein